MSKISGRTRMKYALLLAISGLIWKVSKLLKRNR